MTCEELEEYKSPFSLWCHLLQLLESFSFWFVLLISNSAITIQRGTVAAEVSCFHDYGRELALSLLHYHEIGRNNHEK